jgi:hypothetical protein
VAQGAVFAGRIVASTLRKAVARLRRALLGTGRPRALPPSHEHATLWLRTQPPLLLGEWGTPDLCAAAHVAGPTLVTAAASAASGGAHVEVIGAEARRGLSLFRRGRPERSALASLCMAWSRYAHID